MLYFKHNNSPRTKKKMGSDPHLLQKEYARERGI